MGDDNTRHAIDAALARNWKQAVLYNTAIIKKETANIDALNRLGFAYLQTGQFTKAKRIYQQVIKLDPYNQIALKNHKKLANLKRTNVDKQTHVSISPLLFLEEPGKTKIASCINLAPVQTLSSLSPGTEVFLKAKNHVVEIRDATNTYMGALPDDLSFRLIKLLSSGNVYQAVVKGIGKNTLLILLREISRGKRYQNQPSFLASSTFISFSRIDSPTEGPDVTPTGETEEGATDQAQTG